MHYLPTENTIVNPCPVKLNIAMNDKLLKGLIRLNYRIFKFKYPTGILSKIHKHKNIN